MTQKKSSLRTFLTGFCMGVADLIPGVSGGTIALISGIYKDLLESISQIRPSFSKANRSPWKFLLPLIGGMGTAIFLLSPILLFLLHNETYRTWLYSAFFGLICGSALFCLKQVKHWDFKNLLTLCLGAAAAWMLTQQSLTHLFPEPTYNVPLPQERIDSLPQPLHNIDSEKLLLLDVRESSIPVLLTKGWISKETRIYHQGNETWILAGELNLSRSYLIQWPLILAGAFAISAMLLPGISGSYLLNILGIYPLVIASLADVVAMLKGAPFHLHPVLLLSNLGVGILCGALLFARILRALFQHYPNRTMAVLTGFMLGALRAVWPFWTFVSVLDPLHLDKGARLLPLHPIVPILSLTILLPSILFALGGVLFVILAEKMSINKSHVAA